MRRFWPNAVSRRVEAADRGAAGGPMRGDAAGAAWPPQSMSTARSDGTGAATPLILLRSEAPLPQFCVPFPLPPPETDSSALRLAALRILSGGTMAEATQPLTYSEQLKQVTIQGWRLKMLELVQVQGGSAGPEDDEVPLGLLLTDEHKCGALEHGDEIVVRLARGHSLADLQLPPLPADYDFAAAAQQPHSAAAPTTYTLARPTEPSSHSSSVQANPTTNFHAYSYPDYRNGYRVVVAPGVHNGVGYRGAPPGVAQRTAAPGSADANRAVQTHQLAALTSMARANSAAGDEARARLAAMGVTPPKPVRARTDKPRKKAALPNTALVIGPGVQGVAGERVSGTPNAMRVPTAPAPGAVPPVVTTAPLAPETALPHAPVPDAARVPRRTTRTGMPPVPQAPTPMQRAAPRSRVPPLQTGGATPRSASSPTPTSPLYHSLGGDLRSHSVGRPKKKAHKSKRAQAMHLLRAVKTGPTSPRTARLFAPLYAPGSLTGGAPQGTIAGSAPQRHITNGEPRAPSAPAPVRVVRNDAPAAELPVRRAVTQPAAGAVPVAAAADDAPVDAGEVPAGAAGAVAAPKQRHMSTGEAMRLLFSQGLTEARDHGAPSESTKAAQSAMRKPSAGARKHRNLFSFGSRKTRDTVVDHAADEPEAAAVPSVPAAAPGVPAATMAAPAAPTVPAVPATVPVVQGVPVRDEQPAYDRAPARTSPLGQRLAPTQGAVDGVGAPAASAAGARPQGSVFQEHVGAAPPATLARKKTFPSARTEGLGRSESLSRTDGLSRTEGPGVARAATVTARTPAAPRLAGPPNTVVSTTRPRAGSWGATRHPGAAPAIPMAGMPLHTRTASAVSVTSGGSKPAAVPASPAARVSTSPVAARAPTSPVAARAPTSPVAARVPTSPVAARVPTSPVARAPTSPVAPREAASPVAPRAPTSPVAPREAASPVAPRASTASTAAPAEAQPVRAASAASTTQPVRATSAASTAQPLPAYLQSTTLAELGPPVAASGAPADVPAAQAVAIDTPPSAFATPERVDSRPNTVLYTQPTSAAMSTDAFPQEYEDALEMQADGDGVLAADVERLHLDKALPHKPKTKEDWGERLREAVSAPIDLSAPHAHPKKEHHEPLGERLLEAVSAPVDLSDEPSVHGAAAARAVSPEPEEVVVAPRAAAPVDGAVPAEPAEPALSRAELRYLEVQRELAVERARQDRAERHRIERLVRRQNGTRRASDVPPTAEEVA